MQRRIWRDSVSLAFLPLFISCNMYAPFASPVNDEDYLEEAHQCLYQGNFACAIANYNKLDAATLSDGTTKQEKLCVVYLSEAGLSLETLLNTLVAVATDPKKVLGLTATSLLPYTVDKASAAASALAACAVLPSNDTDHFLYVLALVVDCCSRMSHTDTALATSDSSAVCNTTVAGNGDGTITKTDIGGNTSGALSAANPGMCQVDVTACVNDFEIAATLTGALQAAELGSLATSITAIGNQIGSVGGGVDAERAGIRLTF